MSKKIHFIKKNVESKIENGYTIEEIAKDAGCHQTTLHRFCRDNKIVTAGQRSFNFIKKNVESKIKNGYTIKEIAKDAGCQPATLHRFCKDNKIVAPSRRSLVGTKSNLLTVIGKLPDKILGFKRKGKPVRSRMWKCQCVCGAIVELPSHSISLASKSAVLSCGCMRARTGKESPRWTGYGDISGHFWNQIKRNAETRGYEFSITIEFVWELFEKQNGKCALTGIDLKFGKTVKDQDEGGGTASLDRIDNDKGYTKSNIQWVHKDVNLMRNAFTIERFREVCDLVARTTKA
jgi:AraC-like DNA-binding protein